MIQQNTRKISPLPTSSTSAVIITYLLCACILFSSVQCSPPIIAINDKRIKLFKDALSWMTFRKNGVLMSNTDVESLFLQAIKEKYTISKFYRTFVAAFQYGVLPKLTLNENDPCDPAYPLKYKNPFNSSVTWHFQKKFTFESYKNRKDASVQYCDYRQGLVCNSETHKCQCPSSTTMSPIEPGSAAKRCLLQKDEVCALVDMGHGNDPEHRRLKWALPEMIFNLEKPEGCQVGTQCRFRLPEHFGIPRCLDANLDNWYPPPKQLGYSIFPIGYECAIGLHASHGMCTSEPIGNGVGFVCYNFGPPRSTATKNSGVTNRIGFCAHYYGSYVIKGEQFYEPGAANLWKHNFIMGFVHRRSVPFDHKELGAYYQLYLDKVYLSLFADLGNRHYSLQTGKPCNVAKTEKIEEIWNFYWGLKEDPPAGQDFVATKDQLNAKLQELIDLVSSFIEGENVCKVYWAFLREFEMGHAPLYDHSVKDAPPLRCVKAASPDSTNNDGTCQLSNDDTTKEFAIKLQSYSEESWVAVREKYAEEKNVDMSILNEDPDPQQCKPEFQGRSAHNHGDILEGRVCADGYICYEDYSDDNEIYSSSCKFSDNRLKTVCHESTNGISYGRCEGQVLDKKIADELYIIVKFSKLGRGQKCQQDVEKDIRECIPNGCGNINKYKMLTMLEKTRSSGPALCDHTRLLECTENGICECVQDTEPRNVRNVSGDEKEYFSDYCYVANRECLGKDLSHYAPLTMSEKEMASLHYSYDGESSDDMCSKGNLCVYFSRNEGQCTRNNTEETGYLPGVHDPPTTYTAGGPGWRHVGGAGHLHGSQVLTRWSLLTCCFIMMITYYQ